MARVITYRLAYVDQTRSLCAACAAAPLWPLGPVTHGEHRGGCAMCRARHNAAQVSDEEIRQLARTGDATARRLAREALSGDIEARAAVAEEIVHQGDVVPCTSLRQVIEVLRRARSGQA